MRTLSVLAVGLFLPVITFAHSGHEHAVVTTLQHPVAPALPAEPTLSPTVLVGAILIAVGLGLGLGFTRKSTKASLVLLLALTVGLPIAIVGCSNANGDDKHPQAKHDKKQLEDLFANFKDDNVALSSDDNYFYIATNAFPSHPMMVGITAWQQQVPLPQPYTGKNSWKLPLKPVVADKPISTKKALFRGAIAVAVNGVPIFNALNNRGEDAFLAGELDEYGGHCGRGDDYHYHIAPVHLEKTVGIGKPIGYALDGFPLYGYKDADGKEPKDLDEFNGRYEKDGSYRYYSTKKYPYINGGLRGVVTVKNDQIEPQPKDSPLRPAGNPLRGAKITKFERDDKKSQYTLTYELKGGTYTVKYTIADDKSVKFVFTDPKEKETTETYRSRR
jgi:hypothetical protein